VIPLYVVAGMFGSLIGSFLNVVIYRLPRGIPMGMERSKCPRCSNQIAWYDNIPLFSWLVLRARCRACRSPISVRYPAVELLTAALFVVCFERTLALEWTPLTVGFLVAAVFSSVLVALAFIDLDLGYLPDSLTVKTLLPLGALGSIVVPSMHGTALLGHDLASGMKPGLASLLVGLVSSALGFAIMTAVGAVGRRRRSGSPEEPVAAPDAGTSASSPVGRSRGAGDAKLAAAIGLLLGLEPMFYALGIAFVLAAVVGGIRFLVTSRRTLPLGPFLGVGALAGLFYGEECARLLGAG